MPEYRRALEPGGTFFFTLVTSGRAESLCQPAARACLRHAFNVVQARYSFEVLAIVLLPQHLHCLWKLPETDGDFSRRWAYIKGEFTRRWLACHGTQTPISASRRQHRERGVWEKRFWEHVIRDERDLIHHLNYIHYNPVKHGLAQCPHEWPFSSFARWTNQNYYAENWQCSCQGRNPKPLDFGPDPNAFGE